MVLFLFFLVFAGEAGAKIRHGLCVDCHTMHNSQGGVTVANGTVYVGGPIPGLLRTDCIGCHTGVNDGNNTTPYVYSTQPDYGTNGFGTDGNTLAGGNFFWVTQNDDRGHNVVGIAVQDATLGTTPPGGTAMAQQLHCAGTYGCHGDPGIADDIKSILGAHHADDSTIDGSTVGKSYRFLKGVLGYEDPLWEYQPTPSRHNQYKGVDRASETEVDTTTISALCARCHGDFHSGAGNISKNGWGSPWLRHPTDYDLGNTASNSEYRNYPGVLVGQTINGVTYANRTYAPEVPLGSVNASAPRSTVTFNDDAIITCITCHRAHGSPYPKALRWDYWGWPGNGKLNGCNACHTTKD
ncbi:cytochrome c3 family protein [Thermosulfurimonas sp. F29]|uniref:cytochrome c3 family protein n=1 Tax=Thermosulfurimonas sp. F29 TaxID=2867247 RepID=UPI001C83BA8D|nr:cytochrome c3 family protein [Thermosulfurimonas sp. F29]MBX6422055.1 hypothetical protein [Thermosulfurimonas sp. F29]